MDEVLLGLEYSTASTVEPRHLANVMYPCSHNVFPHFVVLLFETALPRLDLWVVVRERQIVGKPPSPHQATEN